MPVNASTTPINIMSYKRIEDYLYEEENTKIRHACEKVWQQFGGAFKESIIDKALTEALEEVGLFVENQKRIDIFYNDKKVGTYVIDKVINGKIIIELKRKIYITEEDKKQFWYYLKGTNYKVGYLINFNPKRTQIFRRVYDKARRASTGVV